MNCEAVRFDGRVNLANFVIRLFRNRTGSNLVDLLVAIHSMRPLRHPESEYDI